MLDLPLRDFSEDYPINYADSFSDQNLMDARTPFARAPFATCQIDILYNVNLSLRSPFLWTL